MHSLLSTIDVADEPILNRAREICRRNIDGSMTEAIVRDINAALGTDMATAVLYAHFESKLLAGHQGHFNPSGERDRHQPLLVAIVPGAFYKEHPQTGGDGRDLIELSAQQDWLCERIPCESLGTLAQNAAIINDYLRDKLRCNRVILVSLSKGTMDATTAQASEPGLFRDLVGWVSVSGISRGTKMADWLLDRWRLRPIFKLMLWYHGADQQAVRDLRHETTDLAKNPLGDIPIPIVHVSAFPMRRHLSCWRARLWHRRFKREGPNDSVVMLADMLRLPGVVIPVWGADHYLRGRWKVSRAVASIVALLAGVESVDDDRAA
jgi:hypothetical protein